MTTDPAIRPAGPAPGYLTSPGAATSERHRWELQIEKALTQTLEAHTHVLTASAFRDWGRVALDFVQRIPGIPVALVRRVLGHEPTPTEDLSPAELAKRIAPTLATAAFNLHVLHEMSVRGFAFKMWVTRHDPKVRPTHAAADGQKVRLGDPFVVGGELLQYPADSAVASIELWINCRCVVVAR